jgi:catechol 2,3-dioxygenase-like lactoylglutathione lyase family enzyme
MLDDRAMQAETIVEAIATHEALRPTVWTGHLVLHGTDAERSAAFYEQLGMRTVVVMPPFAIMELRGGTHLVIRTSLDHAPAAAPFDLMVEDLPAARAAWRGAGIAVSEVRRDELDIHDVFTVTDPDGNTIVVNDSHVVGPA